MPDTGAYNLQEERPNPMSGEMAETLQREYDEYVTVISACKAILSAGLDNSNFSEGAKVILKGAVSDLFEDLDGNAIYTLRHEIDDAKSLQGMRAAE